jgi:aryl-alcohol dehydrogenase-like predicted oxidoreductase
VAPPAGARAATVGGPGKVPLDRVYAVVDVVADIAAARGVSIAQVALNYILHKPGIDSVIIGARDEAQLKDNLSTASWQLTAEEVERLDKASYVPLPYPYWHQGSYGALRNPYYREMYRE